MTRAVALRTSAIFLVLATILAALGTGQGAVIGQAVLLTSLLVGALTAAFALAAPGESARPVPIRVRARR